MTYEAVECFLVEHSGTTYERVVMWDGACGVGSLHSAREPITKEQWDARDYRRPWPELVCGRCGQAAPPDVRTPCPDEDCDCVTSTLSWSAGEVWVWSTPTGKLEPGAVYLQPHYYDTGCHYWDNCDGVHLHAVLPNGHSWDVDSRASNCTMPDDRVHRCWVREGVPPVVNVAKTGLTCAAGAGSILSGDYHGFLQAGWLTAG